jgi:hypothetical protein
VDLSKLVTVGAANWNENTDGMMTLTNSNLFEKGAAWTPTRALPMWEYHLQFEVRVGPNNTAGDGIALAVLQGAAVPALGNDGDGIGLRGLPNTGYAVIVDMYKTSTDVTDLATTTLKLVTMPAFVTIANVGLSEALNDGKVHLVEVSLTGGSTLSATVHGPTLQATVTKTDPAFATTTASYVGFTAATGGGSNSHNEVATLTVLDACR